MNIFGINKEKMEEEMKDIEAECKAKQMVGKLLSQILLKSNAPEHMKLSVLVIDKAEELHDGIRNLVKQYVDIGERADAETLKKVLEYLSLVEIGIKQFAETTPFVEHIEEENK